MVSISKRASKTKHGSKTKKGSKVKKGSLVKKQNTMVGGGDIYKIRVFDDGNAEYENVPNKWVITKTDMGKSEIKNVETSATTRISTWKLEKINIRENLPVAQFKLHDIVKKVTNVDPTGEDTLQIGDIGTIVEIREPFKWNNAIVPKCYVVYVPKHAEQHNKYLYRGDVVPEPSMLSGYAKLN